MSAMTEVPSDASPWTTYRLYGAAARARRVVAANAPPTSPSTCSSMSLRTFIIAGGGLVWACVLEGATRSSQSSVNILKLREKTPRCSLADDSPVNPDGAMTVSRGARRAAGRGW